jgi:hypothetical protein
MWNKPVWEDITIRRADDAPFWIEDKGKYLVEIMYNPEKDTRPVCTIKVVCSKENQVFLIENYRVNEDDPAAIWTDICSKYGFVHPGNHLKVEGNPNAGQIVYTYKLPASVINVQLPIYQSRTFKIFVKDEAWDTGEIVSPAAAEKDAIWNQLSEIRPLRHFSQFQFSYAQGEIPATSRRLLTGHISVARIKFPVTWRLELFDKGIIQENMDAGQSIQEAWALLHNEVPRLYPDATFNYTGFLQPGLTVTVGVLRANVKISFSFEVKDHGWITYQGHDASNMVTRQEIYTQYAQDDPRIPPLAEYIEEDTRPYQTGDLISFKLKRFIEITDRSNEGPGRNGGDNGRKIILPPIVFGKPPINTTDPKDPKVQSSAKGPIGTQTSLEESESDSFPTDSEEDITGYGHRLARIAQALRNHEPVMVVFVGEF